MVASDKTKKLTLWWPNSANSYAEHDVLLMTNALWSYKYGSVAFPPGTTDQVAVVEAASDPTDVYDFAWNSDDPRKIATRTGLPPISSARWNPDVGHSTNTNDVLNMTFYKTLNIADSSALINSGSRVALGLLFYPDVSNLTDRFEMSDAALEWKADTSTPSGGNGNSNNDGAMMLAQGLAAGAALLAAFSF